jgi:ArsR family transcriptional regulator
MSLTLRQARLPTPSLESVFKALGHRVRLQIVRELIQGERCVCELVELSGLAWSSVSRHLSVLRHAGVVGEDKRGAQVFYHLRMQNVANFIRYMEDPEFRKRADAFVASLR